MKTFKTIASLLVGTVSSLLLMGCGEIDTGTETSAWEKETAAVVAEEPETEIILGDIGGASTLQEAVADFNSKNDGITITIHDYYEENINDGISRLYDDILTGKGPDIISFSTDEMDVEVLREKGAIENLIPYLEKSDVIGEEDIVDSAYHVLTADGGLYMLPTNFVLYTLITKEKWCSNKENFTFEEALRAVRECEEDPMISRDLFLQEGAICGGYSGETEEYLFLSTVSPLTVKARTKKKHGSLWKAILLRKDRKRLLPIGISQYCKMCWTNSLVIAESRNIIRHRMEKERNFLF